MPAHLTEHAVERCKERGGWNRKAAQHTADKALETGLQHADAKGALRRYFDHLYLTHRNANNVRIYGRHVFVFCEERLVTVLHLAHEHVRAAADLLGRKKVKKSEPAEAGTTIPGE